MTKIKRPIKVNTMIYDALCRLIKKDNKSFSDITIEDIINEAEVCRNSFYRNYKSKENVFQKQFDEICEKIGVLFNEQKDFTQNSLLYAIFETARQNKTFFYCYYKASPKLYFDTMVTHIIESNTTKELSSLSAKDYYTYAGKAWICTGILTEWILRDCDLEVKSLISLVNNWQFDNETVVSYVQEQ